MGTVAAQDLNTGKEIDKRQQQIKKIVDDFYANEYKELKEEYFGEKTEQAKESIYTTLVNGTIEIGHKTIGLVEEDGEYITFGNKECELLCQKIVGDERGNPQKIEDLKMILDEIFTRFPYGNVSLQWNNYIRTKYEGEQEQVSILTKIIEGLEKDRMPTFNHLQTPWSRTFL